MRPHADAHRRRWTSVVLATTAILAAAACSSTDGGTAQPATSSSPPSTSPTESVPPGVAKDSVLDLNSTKDMTGIVTTITFADSPYAAHLPDICTLIPPNVITQLGATRTKRGFTGTQLVAQTCIIQPPIGTDDAQDFDIGAGVYVNNIREILDQPSTKIVRENVQLTPRVIATVYQNKENDISSITTTCRVAWGTFYGSATINYTVTRYNAADPCVLAVQAAETIAPLMPAKPVEMRPTP